MKQLDFYLNFPGNCEEALNFYAACLDGTIESLQRFGEAPGDHGDAHKNLVMHANFKAGNISFMASDQMPGAPVTSGNQVNLCLSLTDEDEQTAIFEKLSAGGTVTMPLEDTFWGARFGMLVDKYGVNWMTNCEKAPQPA